MTLHRFITHPLTLAPALILAACGRGTNTSIKEETAGLAASAKIDPATARSTALARAPGGKIVSEELEQENGMLVYSFDIKVGSQPGIEEVLVDATDGKVVSATHETPAMEAEEAKHDSAPAHQ
jgi:hypothetical protein